jgi:peptide/nickel transport system substrate-binding protein
LRDVGPQIWASWGGLSTVLALLLGLLALGGGCARQRVPNDELVVLIENPPRNIDPRYTTTSIDFKLTYLAYARMVDVENETMEPRYDLAESVEPLPGLPEKGQPLRYQITLREAKFSDGSPVTAADIAYTIDKLVDDKTGSAGLRRRFAESGLVRPLEIVSPRVLRIAFAHSHATAITDLDFGIVKSGSFEKPSLFGLPIGAGPFVPVSEAGEVTRFIRNAFYHGGAPAIERLTVRVVRDANSRLLSLVGGSADLTQNTVSPLLFDAVSKWKGRLQLASAPSAILFYMGMNNEDARLSDRRVRRAIAHAIDRDRIVRTKLHGKAQPATSLLPPFHWAYSPPGGENAGALTYDPAAAKKLLDEAGYPDPDGDGPGRRFTLVYKTSTDALPVTIARVIAAQLAEVGIGVDVRPLEFHIFLSDVKKGNYHLYTLQSAEIAEPNMFRNFLHSAYAPSNKNLDAGINRMRYRNAEMDAMLNEGQREMDRLKRRQIYEGVQAQLLRDLPMLPLWHPDNVVVLRREVSGYRMMPTAQFSGFAGVSKSSLSALVRR